MRDPGEVSASIATNVRRLRAERGFTLDALAARGDLSKGTLIQVEQARANPSVSTLCRIADALGVGVGSLIEAPPAPHVQIRRRSEASPLWTSEAGSHAVFLVGSDPPQVVELWDWELGATDVFEGEAHPPGTLEMLTVIEGSLLMTVDDKPHELATGDSMLFEAHVPHSYANPSADEGNRFLMSVLQPTGVPLEFPDPVAPVDEA